MSEQNIVTRREFVKATSGAIAGTSLFGVAPALGGQAAPRKRRYATIGTGDRATSMWGRPIMKEYSDVVEFVGPRRHQPEARRRSQGTDWRQLSHVLELEGYRVAFNGEFGRLEVRDYERQPWEVPEADETEIYVTKSFGKRRRVPIAAATEGGHGGGDTRLRDLIFRKADAPDHMKLPDSRAGAMSCLTGIAARKSVDEKRAIRIADLVRFPGAPVTQRP